MIIWGMSYLSIKVVVSEVDPLLSAFHRFFIASIILFVVLKVKYPEEKILKEDRVRMALGGFFGVGLYFFFENYSVLYTSASNVAILLSSIPVFTLLAQRLIFKERLNSAKIFGAVFSVIGIVIIISSKEKISLFSKGTLGDLMALGAALCWVLYNIVNSKFKGNYKSITITTYQALWGCLFLTPSLFLSPIFIPSGKVMLNTLYLAVFCSCVGYAIYIYCLKHLGATVLTTYINLQPIVSVASAFLILKEDVTIWQALGCFVIILGVTMVSFGDKINIRHLQKNDKSIC